MISERTSELWGSDSARWRSEQWVHWLQHPKVQEPLNSLATGKPHKNRYANFVERFFSDPSGSILELDRGITLACGYGEFERGLSQNRLLRVHEAVDISQESINHAIRLATSGTRTYPIPYCRISTPSTCLCLHMNREAISFWTNTWARASSSGRTSNSVSSTSSSRLACSVQTVRYRQRDKKWSRASNTGRNERRGSFRSRLFGRHCEAPAGVFRRARNKRVRRVTAAHSARRHHRKFRGRQSSFHELPSIVLRFANIIARRKVDAEQSLSGEDGRLTGVSQ